MAKETTPVTPRNMRPRSTPNAEINAQQGDEVRYEQGVFPRPAIKDVPTRGYKKGGKVKGKTISSKKF